MDPHPDPSRKGGVHHPCGEIGAPPQRLEFPAFGVYDPPPCSGNGMSMVSRKSAFAYLLVGCGLCAPLAHAQSGPVKYWLPGWPVGFSDSGTQGLDSYGNFPSFTANGSDSGFFSRRYSVTNNWAA